MIWSHLSDVLSTRSGGNVFPTSSDANSKYFVHKKQGTVLLLKSSFFVIFLWYTFVRMFSLRIVYISYHIIRCLDIATFAVSSYQVCSYYVHCKLLFDSSVLSHFLIFLFFNESSDILANTKLSSFTTSSALLSSKSAVLSTTLAHISYQVHICIYVQQ